jgi:hypothetical protein
MKLQTEVASVLIWSTAFWEQFLKLSSAAVQPALVSLSFFGPMPHCFSPALQPIIAAAPTVVSINVSRAFFSASLSQQDSEQTRCDRDQSLQPSAQRAHWAARSAESIGERSARAPRSRQASSSAVDNRAAALPVSSLAHDLE